jgi:rRNA small subunit pseudouridine methyltransferase Nep1
MSDSSSVASDSSEEEERVMPVSKKQKTGPATAPPLEVAAESDSKKKKHPRVIVLLDQARLETVKNRRGMFELLNCDDHRDLCKKKLKKDPKEFRPDICHQELLALIDSPLNKSNNLQVYMRTSQNVLVHIHPSIRIPRTFKRFSGLMVQLLHKMKIKASNDSAGTTLLKVIKNPFSQHLPPGTRVYGMSCQGKLYSPHALARTATTSDANMPPTCFVIGAMASGHITMEDHPYIEEMISVSEYPLSGAAAISRILGGIEEHFGIV